ncbi:MAG: phospho-sugar mutase, partial [Propionibacteriaceae bacterium]
IRATPPTTLLGAPITAIDLAQGAHGLAPTNAIELCGERVHVVVRPSGTEPKLKCYIEFRQSAAESADIPAARERAAVAIATLRAELSAALGLDA